MLYEAGYDKIELYPAAKGMNKSVAPELLKPEYSYYIENIMPTSLGEGRVRYGTSLVKDVTDTVIESFPFATADGTKQQVIYFNGYQNVTAQVSNLVIEDSNHIFLSTPDVSLFEPDTYLSLQYLQPSGLSPFVYLRIRSVTNPEGSQNLHLEVDNGSFPTNLQDFYVMQETDNITYISGNSINVAVPANFTEFFFYRDGQRIKLKVNAATYDLTVETIDNTTPTVLNLTFNENIIDPFDDDVDTVTLDYESLVPQITSIFRSVGYIKVLDMKTNELLDGDDQTITGLSVACIPRHEYFGNKLWIVNGVDPVMTWDGEELKIYEEPVKEFANSFNRVDNTHFSFVSNAAFDITKYQDSNTIQLKVNGSLFTTVCSSVAIVGNVITITTADNIPAFTGQDRIELFYMDKPPRFNYLKKAHDRLWGLGSGAAGIGYRTPDEALRVYYSYTPYSDETPFRFFNETTKTTPSENISAKHGVADNLEAIANISGHLAFIGRHNTQIWSGIDPLTDDLANSFTWSSTIPVGTTHGNLVTELANDAYFISQNGVVSFGTLNVARQFAASPTNNVDKVALEYLDSIDSNFDYRACRSFKYTNGGFCGFKIGNNNVIVARYDTAPYWWGIFSGDFAKSNTFLPTLDNSLYLFLDNKVYRYADGSIGVHKYGDNDGKSYINFIETKYVNNIRNRYANKRYEIKADYSSDIVINPGNVINIIVRGDLVDSFTLQSLYELRQKGDVLGTIKLVSGDGTSPSKNALGMRLNTSSHTKKDRLKFVSSNFSVSLVGQTRNGPFTLKEIKLLGIKER
jgi:hypothetical protein